MLFERILFCRIVVELLLGIVRRQGYKTFCRMRERIRAVKIVQHKLIFQLMCGLVGNFSFDTRSTTLRKENKIKITGVLRSVI